MVKKSLYIRPLITIIAILMSFALAQTNNASSETLESKFYIGGGGGVTFIVPYTIPTVHLHLGARDIFPQADLRMGVEGIFFGSIVGGYVSTDLIYRPNKFYFGSGARLSFLGETRFSLGAIGGFRTSGFYTELEISYLTFDGFAGSAEPWTLPTFALRTGMSFDL